MKKVVVASLLAVAGIVPAAQTLFAEPMGNPFVLQAAAGGGVQMSAAEYKVYQDAVGQTDPKAKASALEAYLTAYPQSAVKADTLQQLMLAYSQFDPAKTLDAADRLVAVDPNNLRALTFEVYFRKSGADQLTDPAAKEAALDKAAEFAQKGLAATKPEGMADADFKQLQDGSFQYFYSAIAADALGKKDAATAIDNYKKELASVPVDQTTKPGPLLQDTYYLGTAYMQMNPPDLLNCAFYVARFVAYAPEPYKSQMAPTAKYCYRKYHGKDDGFDAVQTAATASLNPPADFATSVTPAPKASDIAHQTVTSTSDLATLALSDKEFILQNGTPEDAQKVFDSVKGKDVSIPDATVIEATDSVVKVAVSDDAVQTKAADFTFTLKEPAKAVPAAGDKITIAGTYDSFTQNPLVINMVNASITPKKAPAALVHRAAPARHK